MLSRVASNVFWMSRYIERAENVARFLEVHQSVSLRDSDPGAQWGAMIKAGGAEDLFAKTGREPTGQNVLHFLMFDRQNPSSIVSCVEQARENARTVRESISNPMWDEVQRMRTLLQGAANESKIFTRPAEFLTQVRRSSHAMFGVTNTTLSHDDTFHFAKIGRTLERADMTSRILDVKYYLILPNGAADIGTPVDTVHWTALLKSGSALQMYRQRHGRIRPRRVAEFLLLDRDFPRSAAFCLAEAESSLHVITGTPEGQFRNRPEQLLGRLRSNLQFSDIEDLFEDGLHESINDLQIKINDIGGAIGEQFFSLRSNRPKARQSQSQSQSSGGTSQTQSQMQGVSGPST